MRAKQSSTADGTYTGFIPSAQAASVLQPNRRIPSRHLPGFDLQSHALQRPARARQPVSPDLRGEGLLHDARNLVSAIGLYCDLLSMPGVLKPEHRQYPEELRLLGSRSRVLIEHLLRSLVTQNMSLQNLSEQDQAFNPGHPVAGGSTQAHSAALTERRVHPAPPWPRAQEPSPRVKPVALRATVERCSGLLSRVANGHPIEIVYGAAADLPLAVSEEAIERILVNLVRNAAQALDREPRNIVTLEREPGEGLRSTDLPQRHHRRHAASSQADPGTAIRISVGTLSDRIGGARSWPFQHVRLVVEDFGCGMEPRQLQSLISGQISASRGTHGIGFRVVRELVSASQGNLTAVSTPGTGTQIHIEWPVAATPTQEKNGALMQTKRDLDSVSKTSILERQHRSIPLASQTSAIVEGRPGVN